MSSSSRTPGRPLRADAARNRQLLLDAARDLFAERGLQVTLDDVARRAGVGVGTAYRRFANRRELIEAVLDDAVEQVIRLAEEAAAREGDAWEAFEWFFVAGSADFARNRGLRELLFQGGGDTGATLEGIDGRLAPAVESLLARARAAGVIRPDLEHADFGMLQLMLGAVTERAGDTDPDLWRRYATLLLDGLRAERSATTPLDPPAPSGASLLARPGSGPGEGGRV